MLHSLLPHIPHYGYVLVFIVVFLNNLGVPLPRFIPLFPPVAANSLAGMAKMPWRIFYFYNLMGSAVYAISYTLIGYFLGRSGNFSKPGWAPRRFI
jgi:membrane protein DedA with SNARE-associated domain